MIWCDHKLRAQGDISTWPDQVTWCARCGAIKSGADGSWHEPRAMVALRLLLERVDSDESKYDDVMAAVRCLVEGGIAP